MSDIRTTEVLEKFERNFADNAGRDAFGSLRVSEGKTLFDTQFQYGTFEGSEWNRKENGTATLTHLPNEACIELKVGTGNGDSLVWQSKRYVRYQPGKSQKILMTTVFGAQKVGVTKRLGYFDADNGIFFEQNGESVSMVIRSKTTGSVVENRVEQKDWNVDKMDGRGASGVTLDSAKAQIFFIDLEWLSVGRVRVGFVIRGVVYYVHYFNHSNHIDSAYMTTANLPIRYEITNTAVTDTETSIKAICCSVQSEGGFIETSYFPRSISSGLNAVDATTRRPILSIRPKQIFKGQINRGDIAPLNAFLVAGGNDCLVELVIGGTLTGGSGVWTSAGEESIAEYNTDRTAISGGVVIESFYAITGSGSTKGQSLLPINTRVPLTLDIDGANPTNLSIVVTSLTGTVSARGGINWRETY